MNEWINKRIHEQWHLLSLFIEFWVSSKGYKDIMNPAPKLLTALIFFIFFLCGRISYVSNFPFLFLPCFWMLQKSPSPYGSRCLLSKWPFTRCLEQSAHSGNFSILTLWNLHRGEGSSIAPSDEGSFWRGPCSQSRYRKRHQRSWVRYGCGFFMSSVYLVICIIF